MISLLLDNAMKYSSEQGIIRIALKRPLVFPLHHLYDFGVGIDDRERRFDLMACVRDTHGRGRDKAGKSVIFTFGCSA